MSVAAPKKRPKLTDLSRPAVNVVVLLGPDDGSTPSEIHSVDYLHLMRLERVAGGSRMNTAVFDYDLGLNEEHIVDTLTPKAINRQIEIREHDYTGHLKRVLGWGKLASQPVELGDRESLQFVARIDKQHFGEPLGKVPFWNPLSGGSVVETDRPLIFNPEIDEVVRGNRSNKFWAARDNAYVWFDAAAINTAAARTLHGQTPDKWKVYEAVHSLLWLCNPNETFIKNLSLAECFSQLNEVDDSHEYLKNLTLKPGQYLPQLLDDLLERFGCSWTIDVEQDTASGDTVRKFRFFRRNHGTQRELFIQRPGEKLDAVKSKAPKLNLNFDIANLANEIVGCSSRKKIEGTWELFKGWPTSEDNLDRDNLQENTATAKAHPHAGHKWILNESGAWTGLRPEITHTDLTSVLGSGTLPTCRKFLPCLSRVSDGASDTLESRGIFVEWKDPDDNTWKKVTWSYSVLELECGIWFEEIPKKLWDAVNDDPTTARIRVTATIESDSRIYATALRDNSSPNADRIVLRLNLGDKFHSRSVHSSSIFAADLATADVIDDTINLQAYVEAVRGTEDSAELSCSVILEGWDHPEYEIGNIITSVNGRNLKMCRNNPTVTVAERYLQIMGKTYIKSPEEGQRMELLLESFDEEQAF